MTAIDATIHLARVAEALEKRVAESVGGQTADSVQQLDISFLAVLRAEQEFLAERNKKIAIPTAVNHATGLISIPTLLTDLKKAAEQNSALADLLAERVVNKRCPHCFCNVKLGGAPKFVPIVTYEGLDIKEEGSWVVVSRVHRVECGDEDYIRLHNDLELADGLVKPVLSRKYRWRWEIEELEIQ